ncbi:MAG: hypothetical protein JWN34_4837, partial [Bryobacterales bacterium]|nr:hypothetical protein [Bryobacterales bacterium]
MSLRRGRMSWVPVVPGRLEFAAEVRRRMLAERPQVVAVELPATLESLFLSAVKRLPAISVIVYNDTAYRANAEQEQAVYVPVEPADPFIEAIRTAQEIGAQVVFADPDSSERPHLRSAYPDSYALKTISLEQYTEAWRLQPQPRTPEIESFAAGIAWKLQGADPFAETMVVISLNLLDAVLEGLEIPQPEPVSRFREQPRLLNPHPDCLGEILSEYPYLQERYEKFRETLTEPDSVDRPRVQIALFREAAEAWQVNTGEMMHHWQRRLLARYTRNLALAHHDMIASLYDIAIAARSIVDENFAWDVWETAGRYSWQETETDIETANFSGEQIWVDTKQIRLRRRLPSTRRRMTIPGLKPRKKEQTPGEWASDLNGTSICSYPPEDIL